MFAFMRTTITTDLRPHEVAAKIVEHTFEADPNGWWWGADIGGRRWIGIVAQDEFMFRRPYMTEGFFHPLFSSFYGGIGFTGTVSDTGEKRKLVLSAVLRNPVSSIIAFSLMFGTFAALGLSVIVLGDAPARLIGALLLVFISGLASYQWWGCRTCARQELRFLSYILEATVVEKTARRS